MASPMCLLEFLLLFLMLPARIVTTSEYLNGTQLTVVPANLPSTTTDLFLHANSIIKVYDNSLTGMPLLERLILKDNLVETITKNAFNGTRINYLDLGNNKLKGIPHLGDLKDTLTVLRISNNLIKSLYTSDFMEMYNLREIYLNVNPISNVGELQPYLASLVTFEMTGMQFLCCRSMTYLKDIPQAVTDPSPCILNQTPWASISRSFLSATYCSEYVDR